MVQLTSPTVERDRAAYLAEIGKFKDMVKGFVRSPITALLAITRKTGKPAGYTNKHCGFIRSKPIEHPSPRFWLLLD